jgi:transcriptional regulator with XRE-family HTH domain
LEELHFIIARNLKALREERKWSLEKVAELTGVSKTMIGQIERGESSPTIKTIWKIANGLKISFTSLINSPRPDTMFIAKAERQLLLESDGKYRAYSNFPFEEKQRFEMYTVELDEGGFLESEAHLEGTEEYITVFAGELTIELKDEQFIVKRGDSIRFKADKPHSYSNKGSLPVRLSMILYYPS